MGALIAWALTLGLIAAWSYLCVRVGIAVAAVFVNKMIREGKLVVRA